MPGQQVQHPEVPHRLQVQSLPAAAILAFHLFCRFLFRLVSFVQDWSDWGSCNPLCEGTRNRRGIGRSLELLWSSTRCARRRSREVKKPASQECVCVCVCKPCIQASSLDSPLCDFDSRRPDSPYQSFFLISIAVAPEICGSAWCYEAPVTHQDMVPGRLDHVPAQCL